MIIKEIFSKFKDNSKTNCTFLEFQEFSRTKVIFKDFSRSMQTLSVDLDEVVSHLIKIYAVCKFSYLHLWYLKS